jgi:cytochrome c oxidase cbb3-type subunit 2
LNVYVAEGCIGCHTQQVRNIEMDKAWGSTGPSMPSDYFYSKQRHGHLAARRPSLLGSERTGPDLTNVGVRQRQ